MASSAVPTRPEDLDYRYRETLPDPSPDLRKQETLTDLDIIRSNNTSIMTGDPRFIQEFMSYTKFFSDYGTALDTGMKAEVAQLTSQMMATGNYDQTIIDQVRAKYDQLLQKSRGFVDLVESTVSEIINWLLVGCIQSIPGHEELLMTIGGKSINNFVSKNFLKRSFDFDIHLIRNLNYPDLDGLTESDKRFEGVNRIGRVIVNQINEMINPPSINRYSMFVQYFAKVLLSKNIINRETHDWYLRNPRKIFWYGLRTSTKKNSTVTVTIQSIFILLKISKDILPGSDGKYGVKGGVGFHEANYIWYPISDLTSDIDFNSGIPVYSDITFNRTTKPLDSLTNIDFSDGIRFPNLFLTMFNLLCTINDHMKNYVPGPNAKPNLKIVRNIKKLLNLVHPEKYSFDFIFRYNSTRLIDEFSSVMKNLEDLDRIQRASEFVKNYNITRTVNEVLAYKPLYEVYGKGVNLYDLEDYRLRSYENFTIFEIIKDVYERLSKTIEHYSKIHINDAVIVKDPVYALKDDAIPPSLVPIYASRNQSFLENTPYINPVTNNLLRNNTLLNEMRLLSYDFLNDLETSAISSGVPIIKNWTGNLFININTGLILEHFGDPSYMRNSFNIIFFSPKTDTVQASTQRTFMPLDNIIKDIDTKFNLYRSGFLSKQNPRLDLFYNNLQDSFYTYRLNRVSSVFTSPSTIEVDISKLRTNSLIFFPQFLSTSYSNNFQCDIQYDSKSVLFRFKLERKDIGETFMIIDMYSLYKNQFEVLINRNKYWKVTRIEGYKPVDCRKYEQIGDLSGRVFGENLVIELEHYAPPSLGGSSSSMGGGGATDVAIPDKYTLINYGKTQENDPMFQKYKPYIDISDTYIIPNIDDKETEYKVEHDIQRMIFNYLNKIPLTIKPKVSSDVSLITKPKVSNNVIEQIKKPITDRIGNRPEIQVVGGNTENYYDKYIKYKTKYTQLKKLK